MRISHQLVPPGGWKYDGFTAQTFDELVKLVMDHRKSNKLTIGNPMEDIENQIGEKHPEFVITPIKIKIHGS